MNGSDNTSRTSRAYASKAITITAVQWRGDNLSEIQAFCAPHSPLVDGGVLTASTYLTGPGSPSLIILVRNRVNERQWPSLGRQMTQATALVGDWIVRGAEDAGELTVVGAEAFAAQYETPAPVDGGPAAVRGADRCRTAGDDHLHHQLRQETYEGRPVYSHCPSCGDSLALSEI